MYRTRLRCLFYLTLRSDVFSVLLTFLVESYPFNRPHERSEASGQDIHSDIKPDQVNDRVSDVDVHGLHDKVCKQKQVVV